MNTCFKCKNQLDDDMNFCTICGNKIEKSYNELNINSNNNQTITSFQIKKRLKNGIKCKKCKQITNKKDLFCSNCGNNIKKQKKIKKLIKFAIVIGIIFIFLGINTLHKNYKSTEFDIEIIGLSENTSSTFYYLDRKLDKLEFKINTLKSIKNIEIKIYANKLEITKLDLKGKRKIKIEDITLIEGLNSIEITYNLKNKIITKKINIYNSSKENLNDLDIKDNDNDSVPNYLEDVYGSNKNNIDTDNDGINDFDEINKTYTDPCNKFTYNNISDLDYDIDNDSLSNIIEIQNNTNPMVADTDFDGLTDSEELSIKSNPLIKDTDNDGINDYIEFKDYNTSPTEYNNIFSGNISKDGIASIYLENLSLDEINKVSIKQVDHYLVSEKAKGYVMPPYIFNSNKNINNLNISFDYSSYQNKDLIQPTIYKIDIKNNELIEINTTIENNTAKANITDLNSPYVLFDKTKLIDLINNSITENTQNIEINTPEENEYIMFDMPLGKLFANKLGVTNEKITIYCYGECSENSIKRDENILNQTNEEASLFEIKKINFITSKLIKLVQKLLEGLLEIFIADTDIYKPELKDTRSFANVYYQVMYIFDVYCIEDLETIFYGEYEGRLLGSNYLPVDLINDKDTNNDGLSDSITQLIISGKITTRTGINPLEGYTLKQINKNDDYDKDGIKNGDEIILKYDNGYYYLDMKSSPVEEDTDLDNLKDLEDPEPLYPFNSDFMIRDSLKGEPVNIEQLKKQIDDFNNLYNKGTVTSFGTIEYTDNDGNIKTSPNVDYLGYGMLRFAAEFGKLISLEDAARAEDKYFEATGTPYTEKDVSKYLIESPEIIYHLEKTIDEYKRLGYDAVADGKTLVFENRTPRKGATAGADGDLRFDNFNRAVNSIMFLHYASANSIGEISNKDGVYTLKLRYFIEDVYDWATEVIEGNGSSEVEVMYFNKLLLGKAKGFLVHIEYDVTVTFGKDIEDTYTIEKKPIYR